MRKPTRTLLALGLTAVTGAGLAVAPTVADATGRVPTVTVTMAANSISLSSGNTVHAGRVHLRVVSAGGDHVLQLVRIIKRGYTFQQAGKDVNAAFGGNLAAIHRVDTNLRWLGGAEATPGHNGHLAETLYAGTYYFIDQNSNAMRAVKVYGTPPARGWIANSSTVEAYDHGFRTPATLPRAGWTLFRDIADEPHFMALQQVKTGTTAAMVRAYFKSGSQAQPSWALPASASNGVISPGTQVLWHYSLPAGKYLLACWWPDDKTGMPHALMGMWKLVTLK